MGEEFNYRELNYDIYNAEPVLYCSECLSLKIQSIDGIDYCDKCGSTDIEETSIFDWEEKYKTKYKKPFINKSNGKEVRTQ